MTYDYLVSGCWADQVKAGHGKEGDPIVALDGTVFKVYSSLSKIDTRDIGDGKSVFITRGTYREHRWWEFWK